MTKPWVALLGLWAAASALANNLTVTNLSVLNAAGGLADVRFDLNWDNSWRSSWPEHGGALTVTNWDAAWVFLKFRSSGGRWQHAILNASGHVATGGTQIELGNAKPGRAVGAFVHRVAEGNGTLNCSGMSLKWNYAATGLGGTNAVDVSVHAIEMVYIPQGSFYLGTGGPEGYAFYAGTNAAQPFLLESEAALLLGTNGLNSASYPAASEVLPDSFPKGFKACYVMKYEISQGQYADFLNFLDPGMAAARFAGWTGGYRHTITQNGSVYQVAAPDRACNFLSWPDLTAYLKWAGLRPMTELEFEKVCRGPATPTPNERAWGDTLATPLNGFEGVDGSGTETALPANANANLGRVLEGPVRVGLFATPTSNRHQAGAGYYGVLNLSDNLHELTITTADAFGRAFTDEPGDGNEWVPAVTWPANGAGIGLRGASWAGGGGEVSDRSNAAWYSLSRELSVGGRGVRSAP